jgi:hypothetical protein
MMLSLSADNVKMNEKMHHYDTENKKHNYTLEGITREDVENMLRYKIDRVENEKRLANMTDLIATLKQQVSNLDIFYYSVYS